VNYIKPEYCKHCNSPMVGVQGLIVNKDYFCCQKFTCEGYNNIVIVEYAG